jgi:hypothetical protein
MIGLVPTKGNSSANHVYAYLKQVLKMCFQANVNVISVGSDGAASEFNAQDLLMTDQEAENFLTFEDQLFGIYFRAPIFNGRPIIRVQDPKHAKKTARNQLFSGARLLTLGLGTVRYDHIKLLASSPSTVLYQRDVVNVDKQDDGAAYRIFCSQLLDQCCDMIPTNSEILPAFVYLFVLGMYNKTSELLSPEI